MVVGYLLIYMFKVHMLAFHTHILVPLLEGIFIAIQGSKVILLVLCTFAMVNQKSPSSLGNNEWSVL